MVSMKKKNNTFYHNMNKNLCIRFKPRFYLPLAVAPGYFMRSLSPKLVRKWLVLKEWKVYIKKFKTFRIPTVFAWTWMALAEAAIGDDEIPGVRRGMILPELNFAGRTQADGLANGNHYKAWSWKNGTKGTYFLLVYPKMVNNEDNVRTWLQRYKII